MAARDFVAMIFTAKGILEAIRDEARDELNSHHSDECDSECEVLAVIMKKAETALEYLE